VIIEVRPACVEDIPGLITVLDGVAREKRYLAMTEAPPPEQAAAFFRSAIEQGEVQIVGVRKAPEGDQVLGCCDVLRQFGQARQHAGRLGIWLAPDARGKGLGQRLLTAALAQAAARGITRVELSVRVDNPSAKRLYERCGFHVEGLQRRCMCVDGEYSDAWAMARLL
jgi:putative acetyltransferase